MAPSLRKRFPQVNPTDQMIDFIFLFVICKIIATHSANSPIPKKYVNEQRPEPAQMACDHFLFWNKLLIEGGDNNVVLIQQLTSQNYSVYL